LVAASSDAGLRAFSAHFGGCKFVVGSKRIHQTHDEQTHLAFHPGSRLLALTGR
jgi:hypothetical protein